MTKKERLGAERDRLKLMYDNQRELSGGAELVYGIDEAGRGPLCGPVVAGCCILDESVEILYLNDSKKISEKKRELIYEDIISKAVAYGIGSASPQRIDEINILNATYEAMQEAYDNCRRMLAERAAAKEVHISQDIPAPVQNSERDFDADGADLKKAEGSEDDMPLKNAAEAAEEDSASVDSAYHKLGQYAGILDDNATCCVLVDGSKTVPGIHAPQAAVVKGDAKCPAISAASILAKVTRDRLMEEYDRAHPEYGMAKHKGYGTKEHIEAIRKYGITDIYRRSFLKNIL